MKIGLIGTGKIGSVIVKALLRHVPEPLEMRISNRGAATAEALKKEFPEIKILASNQQIIDESDLIFLALRTDIVLSELTKLHLSKENKLISVVPNTTMAKLREILGSGADVCRMTPLPPAADALGTILLYEPFPELISLIKNLGEPWFVPQKRSSMPFGLSAASSVHIMAFFLRSPPLAFDMALSRIRQKHMWLPCFLLLANQHCVQRTLF